MLLAFLATCASLLYLSATSVVIGALVDDRIDLRSDVEPGQLILAPLAAGPWGIHPDDVISALRRFPNSSRLHRKLADFLSFSQDPGVVETALHHARRAVALSPHDVENWLIQASIEELLEDLPGAEASARQALALAPRDLDARWLVGSLTLERGDLDGAIGELRTAGAGHLIYHDAALDRVWTASGEDLDAVRRVTPDSAPSRVRLAEFLLEMGNPKASATEFEAIDPVERLSLGESAQYLNRLIAAGEVDLARELWVGLVGSRTNDVRDDGITAADQALVWNGGFEADILVDFSQFDWAIRPTKYARVSIDTAQASAGRRALRLDFTGLETTRLEGDIQQRTRVSPGTRYRLEATVRTEHLVAVTPPRVYLSSPGVGEWKLASEPVPTGSTDWQPLSVDFTAPAVDLVITIGLEPRFSYEDPTRGTVWFDDIRLIDLDAHGT